jgi:energy-coupling factor transport system permease protein
MEKMIFGRYIPGDSVIHRMDPRSKLIFVFVFICIVFLANNAVTYAILTAFTMLVMLLSKVPVRFFINGLMPILWLVVLHFSCSFSLTGKGSLFSIMRLSVFTAKGFGRACLFRSGFCF